MSKTIVEIDSKVNELYAKTLVTQKYKNDSENPIELKIYVYKSNFIFSSFTAQIGDSIKVKSKVIKKEKAEQKYTDSISSGNAAIFVSEDPNNDNRIIINLGNIPPKEELTFISEFIHYTESSESYEFELFRNLPILCGNNSVCEDSEIKGQVEIKINNKISNINKKILAENLNIKEEKYLDEEKKNDYLVKYEYNDISKFKKKSLDNIYSYSDYSYIPSSKIYFEIENEQPMIFSQNSSLNEKEKNYIIHYRNISKKSDDKEDIKINPGLFIFLIDQSGSMSGSSIKVASKALLLFLQSLPAGSYYQIIGFGSKYKKYDETPKEYNSENIKNSIKLVESLKADLGGTNIYDPLNDVYNSYKIHDNIKLPRNIFLLTDGDIDDKKETLALIEKYSNKYSIYSIGIGNYFDKDLIKNAGIIGKGNYNFCTKIEGLNEVIANEVNNASCPYISDFDIISSLDKANLYKINSSIKILRKNKVNNYCYIIENKNDNNDKINFEIKYSEVDKNKNEMKNFCENHEMIPIEIPIGEELSKLIINQYLTDDSKLSEDEKLKLALKYQIFTKNTSLFAEVELSQKITEEMKTKIIGDKENNTIKKLKPKYLYKEESLYDDYKYDYDNVGYAGDFLDNAPEFSSYKKTKSLCYAAPRSLCYAAPKRNAGILSSLGSKGSEFFSSVGNSIKNFFSFKSKKNAVESYAVKSCAVKCCAVESCAPDIDFEDEIEEEKGKQFYIEKEEKNEEKKEIEKKEKTNINLNNKEDIMKMINTQDFISGFWDINEKTKLVKEKYNKEYELLKGLKDKNIDDKIAMTVLMIYFINKEYPDLLTELVMIMKKAKLYIQEKTKDTYENIVKEIGIC